MWKRVAQAAGSLTGSGQKSRSGVDRVGSKIQVGALTGQDDVSMTSAPGNLNRSDRVRNRVGAGAGSGHVTGSS